MCKLGPVLVFMYFTGYCKLGPPHSAHPKRYNIISVLQSFPVYTPPDDSLLLSQQITRVMAATWEFYLILKMP